MISGGSAGGLAALTWVDFLFGYLHQLNPKMHVFGAPDSGFFLDVVK